MLHQLDEDVLVDILLLSDIRTVLAFSAVDRYFRRIALNKQLWVFLAQDLIAHGILDFWVAESFEDCTTVDLVEEVRRVVVGPRSWSPTNRAPPILRRKTVYRVDPRNKYGWFSLLPGGRYFVVDNWLQDGIWDLSTRRFVWGPSEHCQCRPFYVEVLYGGEAANVLYLCHHTMTTTMKLIRVNLTSGQSFDMFSSSLSPRLHEVHTADLLGDYFVLYLGGRRPPAFVIINWRTHLYALIQCSHPLIHGPKLLPGYLVLVVYNDKSEAQLEIVTLASLPWRNVSEVSAVSNENPSEYEHFATPAIAQRLGLHYPSIHCWGSHLAIYRHPLLRDTFRIAFYAQVVNDSPPPHGLGRILRSLRRKHAAHRGPVLFRFNLSLAADTSVPVWSPLSPTPAAHFYSMKSLTFSGYAFQSLNHVVLDAELQRDGVETEEPREVTLMYKRCLDVCIAPFSAAVPVIDVAFESLEILYFA
ncbi:hypothetical protein C8F01DRAFT_1127498 [Mycena amicta]|nr:hypothetical protein C8F01DRAFT_1127498 [Mycena amicta]